MTCIKRLVRQRTDPSGAQSYVVGVRDESGDADVATARGSDLRTIDYALKVARCRILPANLGYGVSGRLPA